MTTTQLPGRRSARRRAQSADHGHSGVNFLRNIPLYDLLSQDVLDRVHEASLSLLEDFGIDFRHDEAVERWHAAGAETKGYRVRIPRELIELLIKAAPSEFVHHARNPRRSVLVGGKNVAFAPVYGCPFVNDADGSRRYARLSDLEEFVKLAYMSDCLNVSGGVICEPTDIPVDDRHLDTLYAHIRFSDKPFMGAVTSGERARDCIRISNLIFGTEFVAKNAVLTSIINCNSPLVWDGTMLDAMTVYAEAGQALLVTPFAMQGANTPITTTGTLVQINAEALAGMCYAQLVRKGTPVIYGAMVSTVSMQSGAPMQSASEAQHLTFGAGQLARRYRVPSRLNGTRTGSKLCDAQAGYESIQAMYPSILAGSNYIVHAAGWMESSLTASREKFVMDVDQVTIMQRMMAGPAVDEDAFALDAIKEVGPGGHFFGTSHTLSHYKTAFFAPPTSDYQPYETWLEQGARDALQRARSRVEMLLAQYEPPELDASLDDEIRQYMELHRTVSK